MGSVLDADQKPGETRVETVETTATFLPTVLYPKISNDKFNLFWRATHNSDRKRKRHPNVGRR